jgi:hypothetical protein
MIEIMTTLIFIINDVDAERVKILADRKATKITTDLPCVEGDW